MEIVIDMEKAIVGRVASHAAKQSLLGNSIALVNCERAVLSGSKEYLFGKYFHKARVLGRPTKGPFFPKTSDRFVRRIVKGMLPHKTTRGRAALKRIMCYIGLPEQFKQKKLERVAGADAKKLMTAKQMTIEKLCWMLKSK